jgi:SAM-dependent methyltransferase
VNLILNFISKKQIASRIIRIALKLHNYSYKLSSLLAISVNEGKHPKHRIMQYKEWFLDNINKDDVVLDVGCNTGMMPEVMSQKATFVYGVEIEQLHVEVARSLRQKDNIEYICADATIHDYSKCMPVDIVTLSNVLEHIEYRVDFLKKLIKQITWKNKDNKQLLIRVPMIDREWIAIYKKELGLEYRLDNTHFIEYTFEQFKNELTQSEVEILSYHIKFGEIYASCRVSNGLF